MRGLAHCRSAMRCNEVKNQILGTSSKFGAWRLQPVGQMSSEIYQTSFQDLTFYLLQKRLKTRIVGDKRRLKRKKKSAFHKMDQNKNQCCLCLSVWMGCGLTHLKLNRKESCLKTVLWWMSARSAICIANGLLHVPMCKL